MTQLETSPHLKHDLKLLLVLVVLVAAGITALWYAERTSQWFSTTASRLLDVSTREP